MAHASSYDRRLLTRLPVSCSKLNAKPETQKSKLPERLRLDGSDVRCGPNTLNFELEHGTDTDAGRSDGYLHDALSYHYDHKEGVDKDRRESSANSTSENAG
jgi:hypothetical protein